jgi:hypothetical protein
MFGLDNAVVGAGEDILAVTATDSSLRGMSRLILVDCCFNFLITRSMVRSVLLRLLSGVWLCRRVSLASGLVTLSAAAAAAADAVVAAAAAAIASPSEADELLRLGIRRSSTMLLLLVFTTPPLGA